MAKKPSAVSPPPEAPASQQHGIWVPRSLLVVHAVLLVLPWLVIAREVMPRTGRPPRGSAERGIAGRDSPEHDAGRPITRGRRGVWGQLELAPIAISPPLEYIPDDPEPPASIDWYFPNTAQDDVERFLLGAGVGPAQVERLMGTAKAEARIAGVVLTPDRDIVLGLAPQARAHVYMRLAASELNPWQQHAFRFYGHPDEWLAASLASSDTLKRVRPLLYAHEGFRYFADAPFVREQVREPLERRRLSKLLLRESTFLLRLRLEEGANINEIAEYWGRGGRRTDIRPLLESVAAIGAERSIDAAHLLPIFARRHLYRYPSISAAELQSGLFPNCFWTALNFFNDPPDDRYFDVRTVMATLKRDYYAIHDNQQLGDIALFQDEHDTLYHAAVYLADGLVFAKNGKSALAPWTIVPLERIKGYYTQYSGGQISWMRRRGF
jgi:hypothetical protein